MRAATHLPESSRRTATILLSALLLATTTAAPRAQLLTGEWFKITVTADGVGYDGAAQEAVKGKVKKLVRYAQFVPPAVEGDTPLYVLNVYSPTTEGSWTQSGEGSISVLDEDESVIHSASLEVPTAPVTVMDGAPNFLQIEFNGTCKIVLDGESVKSAKITSIGATSFFADENVLYHYGKAKVSMTRVAEDKLPFTVLLAADKAAPEAGPVVETPAEPVQPAAEVQAETAETKSGKP